MTNDDAASWYRPHNDEDAAHVEEVLSADPAVRVGVAFCTALGRREEYLEQLRMLVTPESAEAWGDFASAAALLSNIEDAAYGSIAERAYDDPDVAYLKILSGVTEGFQVLEGQPILAAAVVTLVLRDGVPVYGGGRGWLVHSLGVHSRPEETPHGAY